MHVGAQQYVSHECDTSNQNVNHNKTVFYGPVIHCPLSTYYLKCKKKNVYSSPLQLHSNVCIFDFIHF